MACIRSVLPSNGLPTAGAAVGAAGAAVGAAGACVGAAGACVGAAAGVGCAHAAIVVAAAAPPTNPATFRNSRRLIFFPSDIVNSSLLGYGRLADGKLVN